MRGVLSFWSVFVSFLKQLNLTIRFSGIVREVYQAAISSQSSGAPCNSTTNATHAEAVAVK